MNVSTIIPVYNGENYIERCILSLVNISFIREIIVINDGSTDNTQSKIDILKKKYNNIYSYTIKNHGVSYARNYGIDRSKCDYLMFVDADDYICFHNNLLFAESDYYVFNVNSVYINNKNDNSKHLYYDNIFRFGIKRVYGKIFKKSIILDNNIKFDEEIKFSEDYLFVLNYIYYVSNCLFVEGMEYMQENINDTSLSKQYVSNVNFILRKLNISIKKVLSRKYFPDYFYKYNVGIEFDSCLIKINNLFKKGVPYKKKEILLEIDKYIRDFKSSNEYKSNKLKPRKFIDKFYYILIKIGSSYLIYLAFVAKNIIRKLFK